MMDYAPIAWFNGQFIQLDAIKIPIQTYGLHYGASVFEGIRIYNYKAFKLCEHIQRLIFSAHALKMFVDFNIEELCIATQELILQNNLEAGYIRPLIWRGSGDLLINSFNKPEIAIFMWHRMTPFISNVRDKKALKLTISRITRYNPESYPVGAKVGGLYASHSLAKYIAQEEGFDDALMLTFDGKIAESVTANIFFVKNSKLYTPKDRNILNGITRQLVIDLARANAIDVIEEDFDIEFIKNADECFLTGTACEIAPVHSINDITFATGEITELLYNAFISHILKESK
jgi:branched-chain amino acid aminotransferase